MIICHCERVSDRAVRNAVMAGAGSCVEVADRCGAGGRCGGCHESIQRVLDESVTPVRLAVA
ncbi:MAG: (2Fe-2S)-binding protein [Ilumatobacteraceae bacterium]|nr:(2Fe-2S)-binding protein [Ilumatobacteraceae bacterium]